MNQDDGPFGPVAIRPVRPEQDGRALARIYGHFVRETAASFELVPPDETEMAARAQRILAAGLPFLVAHPEDPGNAGNAGNADGAILGFAYGAAFRSRPAYDGTVETSVYLAPDQARRGAGLRLMRAVCTDLAHLGKTQAIAVITEDPAAPDDPPSPSTAFHTRAGFRDAGRLRRVGRKFNRDWDVRLMQLDLAAWAAAL